MNEKLNLKVDVLLSNQETDLTDVTDVVWDAFDIEFDYCLAEKGSSRRGAKEIVKVFLDDKFNCSGFRSRIVFYM